MKVEFLSNFVTDLDKLNVVHVKASVIRIIEFVETVKNLSEIPNLKKLKGHKSAFRTKMGDYRIGIFIKGKTIEMARVVHRKYIYKVFP